MEGWGFDRNFDFNLAIQGGVMSQLKETDDFYAAGRKLGEYLVDSNGKDISTATLQALMRDFLPQHEEAQEALRSIVAIPSFRQLLPLAGSNHKGVLQRDAFLQSLQDVYAPRIINASKQLINGLLQATTENFIRIAHNETTQTSQHPKKTAMIGECPNEESIEKASMTQLARKDLQSKPTSLVAICIAIVLALTGAALLLIPITGNITLLRTITQAWGPYHVRSGSPLRMPNNTGISNEALGSAILANAKLQCDSETGQNGGYWASLIRYRSYIDENSISNRVTNSNTFQLLSVSLKEAMMRSGSCETPYSKAGIEKVKEWLK